MTPKYTPMVLTFEFNFLSKDQLTKKKDWILIRDLIINRRKYKTEKARLILQSGIYNLLTNILEGTVKLLNL